MTQQDRDLQNRRAIEVVRGQWKEKVNYLTNALLTMDLKNDAKSVIALCEAKMFVNDPNKIRLSKDERLEALTEAEGIYKERSVELPEGMVKYRQLLEQEN